MIPVTLGKCHEFPIKLKTASLNPCRREFSDPPQVCVDIVDTDFWKPVTASVIPLLLFITVIYDVSLLLHLGKLVCSETAGCFDGVQVCV